MLFSYLRTVRLQSSFLQSRTDSLSFRKGKLDVVDKPRSGRLKELEDELQKLLDVDIRTVNFRAGKTFEYGEFYCQLSTLNIIVCH